VQASVDACTSARATTAGITFTSPELVPFDLAGGHLSGGRRVFDILPEGHFVGLTIPSAAGALAAGGRYRSDLRDSIGAFEPARYPR
jgi:hypothetical protein